MSWLLKVVEGPAKGAEVALVDGMRVKVGSSPACDIVLGDVSLAAEAFELDVAESVVTLISPDGTQSQMKPFEIRDFGTTAVALGPADEPWGELVRPAPEPPPEEPPPEPPSEEAPPDGGKKGRGGLLRGVLLGVLALVVLLLILFLMRGCRIRERAGDGAVASETVVAVQTLADIAAQHALKVEERNGAPVLSGHLRRRTERLAIRVLALAVDPGCRFALTDDETMLRASEDLLFAYTDGVLKAVAASNRVVTLAGHAQNAAALERAIRTLDAEVRGIERVDASGVSVGGRPVASGPEKRPVAFAGDPLPALPTRRPDEKKSRPDYQIAGILTTPYPCVIMRNGHRVMEGAQVGTATLVKIEADRLVLCDGGSSFEWRP